MYNSILGIVHWCSRAITCVSSPPQKNYISMHISDEKYKARALEGSVLWVSFIALILSVG